MLVNKFLLDDLILKLRDSKISTISSNIWIYQGRVIVIEFSRAGEWFAIDIAYEEGLLVGSVLGRTDSARRCLRSALIGNFEMLKSDGERHLILDGKDVGESQASFVLELSSMITKVIRLIDKQALKKGSALQEDDVNIFWWDSQPNFGDVIGPWLVSKISHKNPVSGRGLQLASPPLMTVGSILSMADQDGTAVWGSGLMGELSATGVDRLRALNMGEIYAVRGKLTRAEIVKKLGWDVPEVYGDPALLLPRFLPVEKGHINSGVAVVPHFSHAPHFAGLETESVRIVDVKDGMERVVRQIATAKVCISTSLHGLIVAQAYGVPWVWIRVSDDRLGGDTFKFRDFFSTLDSSSVESVDVSKKEIAHLDVQALARTATLPKLQISLDELLASFPQTVARAPKSIRRVMSSSQEEAVKSETMANLLARMEIISDELVEQRRLLERLADQS